MDCVAGTRCGVGRSVSGSARKTKAFTLIELLVVVAIIALLIAILLPSLGRAKRQAIRTQCGTNLYGIGRAIAAYVSEWERAPISQRGGYVDSGWAGNQTIYFRNDLYPGWGGVSFMLAPHAGGLKSKLLVCPATPSSNPLAIKNTSGVEWIDPWPGTTSANSPKNSNTWSRGSYMFFAGDYGNCGKNSGGTPNTEPGYVDNPSRSPHFAYYKLDGTTPHNLVYVPPKLTLAAPDQVLAQDVLYLDNGSNVAIGNHLAAGTYVPESYTTGGRNSANVGYYIAPRPEDFEGANVLAVNGAVEWMKPGQLTQVVNGGESPNKRMYLGFRPIVQP